MTDRRAGIARALGSRADRHRRHRRFMLVGLALLVVATVLLFIGDDDGGGSFAGEATPICDEFEARIRREFQLSFPEGVPTPEAEAEYLSRAFADTTQELVDALAALEPTGAARDGVEAMQALVDQLRDDPAVGVDANPFAAEVAPRFDDAGVPACGSSFLAE